MNASRQILVLWYFLCLLLLLMLLEWLRGASVVLPGLPGLRESLTGLLLAKSGQAILTAVLSLWFFALMWIDVRDRAGFPEQGYRRSLTWCDLCKMYLVAVAILVFAVGKSSLPESPNLQSFRLGIDQSTNVLVLLAGIVLSQMVAVILHRSEEEALWLRRTMVVFFILFFTAASLVHSDLPFEYKYHTQPRWSGLWVNPNTYGLFMGAGIVLVAGCFFRNQVFSVQIPRNSERGAQSAKFRSWFETVFLLVAGGMMAFGLVKSYSRGAWAGAAAGVLYLAVQAIRGKPAFLASWVYRNLLILATMIISIGLLSFWHFKETERTVARRVFSVANANDFSWRNRLTAWEGSLQMMMERPWFGFGWNQSEPAYEQYYRPVQVPDGLAIETNDYLMLGTTLGIPALVFFLAYISRSLLRKAECRRESADLDWWGTVCRAGTLVLLVGFWFDGGLFRMATATLFWVLLELGRTSGAIQSRQPSTVAEGQTP